jgi:hypothetical protein
MMDCIQNVSYINIPSSQTYTSLSIIHVCLFDTNEKKNLFSPCQKIHNDILIIQFIISNIKV